MIRAAESTENIPSARRVRDVVKDLKYLDPDIAPLIQILQQANSASTSNSKFEWFEKDLPARWDAVNGTTGTGTSVIVNNSEYFSVGDIVEVPRTHEKIRVRLIDTTTDTLTVVRAVGSTTVAALTAADDLLIIGNAYQEGSGAGSPKSHAETNPYNYTQITRTQMSVTGTEMESENYIGPDRPRLHMEGGIEHKLDLERTALFGERNISTSGYDTTDNPRRFTGGLYYWLGTASNVKDASGILTEPEIENWLQSVFQHTGSSQSRLLLASPLVISVLDQLAAGRIVTTSGESTYGIGVKQWNTGHGTLNIVKDRLLESGVTDGYQGEALALDLKKIRFRYMRNRNTKLREDIQAPDVDGVLDEYLTEAGWEVANPLLHGRLKGVTA